MTSRAILLQPLNNHNFSSLDQKHSWLGLNSFLFMDLFKSQVSGNQERVSGNHEQSPGQTSAKMTLQIWITMIAVELSWIRITFSWKP